MQQNYVFMTDSDSDLLYQIAEARSIPVVRMPYMLDGVEHLDDNGRTGQEKAMFQRMREGAVPSTSQLPQAVYEEYFEPVLQQQQDLLFVAFSSTMSATIQNVYAAREELLKKYPGRRMVVVDTLSISAPMSALLLQAHDLYLQGASMEEVEKWLLDNRLRAQAWFTVENLQYLKRGGRITAAQAALGSMLQLKPVMTLSREGRIESVQKVQGRKRAMRELADKVEKYIENPDTQEVIILHGDDEAAAEEVKKLVLDKVPQVKSVRIQMLGPVIGAHCGPGLLCVGFMGKERDTVSKAQ